MDLNFSLICCCCFIKIECGEEEEVSLTHRERGPPLERKAFTGLGENGGTRVGWKWGGGGLKKFPCVQFSTMYRVSSLHTIDRVHYGRWYVVGGVVVGLFSISFTLLLLH